MKITILSGSPRQNSNTLRFSSAVQKILKNAGFESVLIDFARSDIALPSQGKINWEAPSAFQQSIITALSGPGLVFVFTPEYNWMPSADIINFLNQYADKPRLDLFDKKIFAMAGISAGRGGRLPAITLGTAFNKIIGFFNLSSFVTAKIFEAQFVPKVIDVNGELLDNEQFNQGVLDFVHYHLNLKQNLEL
jgi:chromate reductase